MNRSPAFSYIRERIELEFQKLEKEKVTHWAFLLSGKEIRLTDFFGKEASVLRAHPERCFGEASSSHFCRISYLEVSLRHENFV
jgi:hypothetical protein